MDGPDFPPDYTGPRDTRAAYLYKLWVIESMRLADDIAKADPKKVPEYYTRKQLKRLATLDAQIKLTQQRRLFAISDHGVPPLPQMHHRPGVLYALLNMERLDVVLEITKGEFPDAFMETGEPDPGSIRTADDFKKLQSALTK